MYRSHYICGDEVVKKAYKIYSNKLTKIKATAKKLYYENELKNMRITLERYGSYVKLCSQVTTRSPQFYLNVRINLNGNKITHQPVIGEKFNEFFQTSEKIWQKTLI